MSVPAGWYDDGSGRQRWWDGEKWTEHFAPAAPADEQGAGQGSEADAADLDATVRREDVPSLADDTAAASVAESAQPVTEISAEPARDAGATPAYAPPAAPGFGDQAQTAAYPGSGAPAADPYAAGAYAAPGYAPGAPVEPKKTPVLGFIGLGLAVLGTILGCIPLPATFGIGMFVLFAALVVSIIAVVQKNTKKWPGITGIILSVVGGVIAITVFAVASFFTIVNAATESFPSDFPTSITEDSEAFIGEGRPSADEVEDGLRYILDATASGTYTEDSVECYAQYFVDSDIPDEVLWIIADGEAAMTDVEALTHYGEQLVMGAGTCQMP